ncbi:hypothetical protein [Aquimarina muelleri]|uniref:Uncharacterized protein n=1 Tax=Aquimarina muelleri TaxID=279356 RepID=A0A918N583_9FLAO|nr:hypothetical protein [Aquimarina muelleri]MCX2762919.1 hypothetical protein [Aquimarina muelleri]GGX27249.1 hypothetical protein GCM10007384_30720 [Aquimarina muelleri]
MNKKVINSILISFTVIIWALVSYKVFKYFNSDTQIPDNSNTILISDSSSLFNFSKDTFDLKKVHRDPFLGEINSTREPKINTVLQSRSKNTKNSKPIRYVWPKLNYYGYVKGVNSSSELILIKIDNKLRKIREGKQLEGIVLKKVYRDSIIVMMNKELKTIVKSR